MLPQKGLIRVSLQACPVGWTSFPNDPVCFMDSNFQEYDKIPIKQIMGPNNFIAMEVWTPANASEKGDSFTFVVNGKEVRITATLPPTGIPELASYWHAAEFNIFGADGGMPLKFRPGTVLTPRVLTDLGADVSQCKEDTSGEVATTIAANNLNLISNSCISSGDYDELEFKESR